MQISKPRSTTQVSFTVGQEVEWSSSSNGTTKAKRGHVEVVIAPGASPSAEHAREANAFGMPRDHESYLVRVPAKTARGQGKLYWPRASALRAVKTAR